MAAGNSTIVVRVDVETFRSDLERLNDAYQATYSAMQGEAERLNNAYRERIKIQNDIAKTQQRLASSAKGSAEYHQLKVQLDQLKVAYANIRAEETAATRNKAALQRQLKAYDREIKTVTAHINALTNAEKRSASARSDSSNTAIRMIRQMESLGVALSFLKVGYNNTVKAGMLYNQLVQDQMIGMQMLISQTLEYVDANGEVISGLEAYNLAAGKAREGFEIVRQINVETTHSLAQMLSIYKLLVPQLLKYGASMEEIGAITKGISLASAQMGLEYQEIIKVVDSLTSGEMTQSGFRRVMAQMGITNEKMKELQKTGHGLVDFLIERLGEVEYAAKDVNQSFTGVVNQFKNLISELQGESTTELFSFATEELAALTKFMKENYDVMLMATKAFHYFVVPVTAVVGGLGAMTIAMRSLSFVVPELTGAMAALRITLAPMVGILGAVTVGVAALKGIVALTVSEIDKLRISWNAVKDQDTMVKEVQRLQRLYDDYERKIAEGPGLFQSDTSWKRQVEEYKAQMRKIELAIRTLGNRYAETHKVLTARVKKTGETTATEIEKLKTKVVDFTDRLRLAKEEYQRLMSGDDAGVTKASEAVRKYELAIEKIQELSTHVGEAGIDQADLKEKILRAQIDAQNALNDVVRVGNDLNREGLEIIEEEAQARRKIYTDAVTAYEQLKLKNMEGYAETEATLDNYRLLVGLYEAGIIPSAEKYNELLEAINKNTIEAFEGVKEGSETWQDQISEIQDAIGSKLENAMMSTFKKWQDGAADFGDFMRGILNDIAAEIFRVMVVKQLVSGITGWLGFEKGAALQNGQVTAYASGGIVQAPTVFPMANGLGLMGEAGPEAVMPLTRTSGGDLGVKAQTEPVTVNVYNYGNDQVEVEDREGEINIIVGRISHDIMRGTGPVPQALETRYGLSKR